MKHIMFCSACKTYTMHSTCPKCKKTTTLPKPPKYSPEDKYGAYRRKAKKEQGLL